MAVSPVERGCGRLGNKGGALHAQRMRMGDLRRQPRRRREAVRESVKEQSYDRRAHRPAVPERTRGIDRPARFTPGLPGTNSPEDPRRPRAIAAIPAVAARESSREVILIDVTAAEERLRHVEGHLRVIGEPPKTAPGPAKPPPDEPLEWTALVRSAERIAERQADQSTAILVLARAKTTV